MPTPIPIPLSSEPNDIEDAIPIIKRTVSVPSRNTARKASKLSDAKLPVASALTL
ncbi:hypothetical protein D3C85_1361520 [compost metagenome]